MRETVLVSVHRNLRLIHAVLLRRTESYSQLPFLLYYLSAMYQNVIYVKLCGCVEFRFPYTHPLQLHLVQLMP